MPREGGKTCCVGCHHVLCLDHGKFLNVCSVSRYIVSTKLEQRVSLLGVVKSLSPGQDMDRLFETGVSRVSFTCSCCFKSQFSGVVSRCLQC